MAKCNLCGKKLSILPFNINDAICTFDGKDYCRNCVRKVESEQMEQQESIFQKNQERYRNMLILSVFDIKDKKIIKYFDIITAECVVGTGIVSELSASIDDFLGAKSTAFDSKFEKAKKYAFNKLKLQALELGANVIIGAKTDYLVTTSNMFVFSISGTPVILEDVNNNMGVDSNV